MSRLRPTWVALAGLACLLLALAFATVWTRSGPATCPANAVTKKHQPGTCFVPADASGQPSSVAIVAASRDLRLSRRLFIVGVGVVAAIVLAAASARLASRGEPLAEPA